ncbi:tyrosine-type recombinase/integrase [Allomesorhizobium camelthorni]|uniref:Site-specific integrase n=1 Tax=Allomesorhizobium camelthorni TaxID=475069 RepID=A0A6G4WDB3_9HYPH|nr:site-specific integrase [Mesorhizobium camelthorni]NGO52328.1 site-specific integrase [Mesorhizobium camelthorni]
MPRTSKGARLVWRDESRKTDGTLRNKAGWFIRDGSTFISAGSGEKGRPRPENEKALADYIASKYHPPQDRGRDRDNVSIADAINLYLRDIAPKHAAPQATATRLEFILDFFGKKKLGDINGRLCRAYVASRPTEASARRQLEDLRAAINYYHKEGYVTSVPKIVLPEKPGARERWLTRSEAARLIWTAWRMKQSWKGRPSDRRTGRHLARFILVALYTGTRSGAVCGAAIRPTPGRGFVDLERGVFYRRAPGTKETKKRQPPVRLPSRLLVHLRRWAATDLDIKTKARGRGKNIGRKISHDYVVEWNGKSVTSVKKAFRAACEAAGLGWYEGEGQERKFRTDITPHTLRHTAATWLMQAGADPWKAAGFLGMTVDVLLSTYGHHHPDYQADAAEKMTSKRVSNGIVRLGEKQTVNRVIAPHSYPTEIVETNVNIGRPA